MNEQIDPCPDPQAHEVWIVETLARYRTALEKIATCGDCHSWTTVAGNDYCPCNKNKRIAIARAALKDTNEVTR